MYTTRKHFEEITSDISAIEGDYVTKTDYINNDSLYATSNTGNDDYEILVDTLDKDGNPVFTGFVDGQRFFVKFDVANIGSASITVDNGVSTFGPKDLTKLNGQPLVG
jgi:hypothetical protein